MASFSGLPHFLWKPHFKVHDPKHPHSFFGLNPWNIGLPASRNLSLLTLWFLQTNFKLDVLMLFCLTHVWTLSTQNTELKHLQTNIWYSESWLPGRFSEYLDMLGNSKFLEERKSIDKAVIQKRVAHSFFYLLDNAKLSSLCLCQMILSCFLIKESCSIFRPYIYFFSGLILNWYPLTRPCLIKEEATPLCLWDWSIIIMVADHNGELLL